MGVLSLENANFGDERKQQNYSEQTALLSFIPVDDSAKGFNYIGRGIAWQDQIGKRTSGVTVFLSWYM
jgi:ribosomal protein L35AE/L33A